MEREGGRGRGREGGEGGGREGKGGRGRGGREGKGGRERGREGGEGRVEVRGRGQAGGRKRSSGEERRCRALGHALRRPPGFPYKLLAPPHPTPDPQPQSRISSPLLLSSSPQVQLETAGKDFEELIGEIYLAGAKPLGAYEADRVEAALKELRLDSEVAVDVMARVRRGRGGGGGGGGLCARAQ